MSLPLATTEQRLLRDRYEIFMAKADKREAALMAHCLGLLEYDIKRQLSVPLHPQQRLQVLSHCASICTWQVDAAFLSEANMPLFGQEDADRNEIELWMEDVEPVLPSAPTHPRAESSLPSSPDFICVTVNGESASKGMEPTRPSIPTHPRPKSSSPSSPDFVCVTINGRSAPDHHAQGPRDKSGRKPVCFECGKRGHTRRTCFNLHPHLRKAYCGVCFKYGHTARRCWHLHVNLAPSSFAVDTKLVAHYKRKRNRTE
ncbi:uncharacterized protein J3D65DRAFT_677603 [Phyllosticta citribraziliensis]|uniref:CCHC-type domain-containing protein n=1 Tax=Phyllosticta citribraziliensis TaxID=989973 RepID=A0ABR1LKS7_9PEZI